MRPLILILGLLVVVSMSAAQSTRAEMTNATTPAEDSKTSSSAVPDVYALSGQFDRVLVLRFKYQTDLLAGLERMVKEQRIRNGVILAGIGSVCGYHIHTVS